MTLFHILAGLLALTAGTVALSATKGSKFHRVSGLIFVFCIGVMSVTGAVLAALKPDALSVIAGLLSLYLVTTAALAVREPGPRTCIVGWVAALFALLVAIAALLLGLQTALSADGRLHGYPPAPFFVFGSVALLGAGLDVRVLQWRIAVGRHRIARHLWRMCCAMFIATSSFFLGQAKIFPVYLQSPILLSLPVLAVLLLWMYWLLHVLRGRLHDALYLPSESNLD